VEQKISNNMGPNMLHKEVTMIKENENHDSDLLLLVNKNS
jgi:hypothetical protein